MLSYHQLNSRLNNAAGQVKAIKIIFDLLMLSIFLVKLKFNVARVSVQHRKIVVVYIVKMCDDYVQKLLRQKMEHHFPITYKTSI